MFVCIILMILIKYIEKTSELAEEYVLEKTTNQDEIFKKDKPDKELTKNDHRRDSKGNKKKKIVHDRADKFW